MNERNSGRGIFYGVIGVATLVVAIIGATFAYFTASATPEGSGTISGGTNDALAASLHITVTRLYPEAGAATSGTNTGTNGLVPADIDATDTAGDIANAANAKCLDGNYVGCHIYKIVAGANQNINHASINLDSLTFTAATSGNHDDWHYALYTANGDNGAGAALVGLVGNFDVSSAVDMHQYAALTANTDVTYYLIVYITNQEAAQNNAEGTGNSNQLGTYTGSVSMNAAGGQVSATFTSAG